jgi:hypothetical protein
MSESVMIVAKSVSGIIAILLPLATLPRTGLAKNKRPGLAEAKSGCPIMPDNLGKQTNAILKAERWFTCLRMNRIDGGGGGY